VRAFDTLAIAAILSAFGLLFLWLASTTFQSWRTLQRAMAKAHRDGRADAATPQVIQDVRRRALLLASVAALFFLVAAWVGWRGANPAVAAPLPRAAREVPRALWTIAIPFYAAIVLAASGLVLGVVAAMSNRGPHRLATPGSHVDQASAPMESRVRRTAAAVSVACLAASIWLASRGFAALRPLTPPQRAVFADCDPVPSSLAALFGLAALGVFLAEGAAIWRAGPSGGRDRPGRRPRVPWSFLWLAVSLLAAGYFMFVGSCEYPEGSS
jgi:hypothetical protein